MAKVRAGDARFIGGYGATGRSVGSDSVMIIFIWNSKRSSSLEADTTVRVVQYGVRDWLST